MKLSSRKKFVAVLLLFWIAAAYYGWWSLREDNSANLKTVTIGYQAGDEFDIAKQRGKFVKKMKAKGYKVHFRQFQNGAALMEAMATSNIDYARFGDVPPVTALASGTKLTFVAGGSTNATGSGILVKKNSGINQLSDLRGKRIAYTRGTSSQYMVLQALKKTGLSVNDVKWVNLDQDAASIAFSKGKVDAWASWDPIVAQVQLKEKVKLLINGNQTKAYNRIYTVSPTKFAKNHEALSKLIIKYIQQNMNWENSHPKKLARLLSKELKISNQAASLIISRRKFGMYKMAKKYVKEEQQLAKAFYLNDVISKEPQIADHTDYLK